MQISVQLYSVRDALAEDPATALTRLAELGFQNVEPFGLPENAPVLAPLLRDLGMAAPSAHAGLLGAEDPDRVLASAAQLGVRTVIEPNWPSEHWETREAIAATAHRLNDLAERAAGHGVRVGYHNHGHEARPLFEGQCALELLVDDLDPRVTLELDTFWCTVGGTDPVRLLNALGQRVQLAHLKDGPLDGDVRRQVPLGEGDLDPAPILAAAPWLDLGVIEFDDHDGDIFAAIGRSREYLAARTVTF